MNSRQRSSNAWLQPGRIPRLGAATLDYVLLLGVILPLVAFIVPTGKKLIQLAYEMMCTLIAWPFL